MDVTKLKDMHRGWFIGIFDPSVLNTEDFEVIQHFMKIALYYVLKYQATHRIKLWWIQNDICI